LHLVEVPAHHAPKCLGVEPFTERGGGGDIGEDDRDGLAGLGRCSQRRRELGSTDAAESKAFRILLAALWTDGHVQRLGMHMIRFHSSAQDERGGREPELVCALTSSAPPLDSLHGRAPAYGRLPLRRGSL